MLWRALECNLSGRAPAAAPSGGGCPRRETAKTAKRRRRERCLFQPCWVDPRRMLRSAGRQRKVQTKSAKRRRREHRFCESLRVKSRRPPGSHRHRIKEVNPRWQTAETGASFLRSTATIPDRGPHLRVQEEGQVEGHQTVCFTVFAVARATIPDRGASK